MKTKIISFYSDLNGDNYYSNSAFKLQKMCDLFNIDYAIEELQSKGSYMLNCLQKPLFIKNMMEKYKCPLIWMDCDTNLLEPFDAFDDISEDIGFASHTGDIQGIKASPIYFNNTSNFNLIIDTWIRACEEGLRTNGVELDHDALKHVVLPQLKNNISVFIIEKNYNDYCNGKYIQNGNSHVLGKAEIHHKLHHINRKRPLK